MVARTGSNSGRGQRNGRAQASVLAGLLALAALPAGVGLARYTRQVSLIDAAAGIAVAGCGLGLLAIVLAARARRLVERTIGRVGGEGLARTGRVLGFVGLCIGLTAALALGVFGLLSLFASS